MAKFKTYSYRWSGDKFFKMCDARECERQLVFHIFIRIIQFAVKLNRPVADVFECPFELSFLCETFAVLMMLENPLRYSMTVEKR